MIAPAPGITSIRNFTQDVCKWGGRTGSRILWQIQATPNHRVQNGFTTAIAELNQGRILGALAALRPIRGLGQFSYSSKHLRMLAPKLCGVFDSVVQTFLRTGYSHTTTPQLFADYCLFCNVKAAELTRAKVKLGDYISACAGPQEAVKLDTTGAQTQWTAADVDMACFAWLQNWCSGCSGTGSRGAATCAPKTDRTLPIQKGRAAKKPASDSRDVPQGNLKVLYLCQNHPKDTAVTLKEDCNSNWNNAWICRDHGSLDFKVKGARGNSRYLIGEILAQGTDVTRDLRWVNSPNGKTCHHSGSAYQGRLSLGSVEDAVRYLKCFFRVVACPCNKTEIQQWINAL
jgi:hypothetical protein